MDHLSSKSDISNYVDVQDVKLTRIDNNKPEEAMSVGLAKACVLWKNLVLL